MARLVGSAPSRRRLLEGVGEEAHAGNLFGPGARVRRGYAADDVATELGIDRDGAIIGVQRDAGLVEQSAERGHVEALAGPVHLYDVACFRTSCRRESRTS